MRTVLTGLENSAGAEELSSRSKSACLRFDGVRCTEELGMSPPMMRALESSGSSLVEIGASAFLEKKGRKDGGKCGVPADTSDTTS